MPISLRGKQYRNQRPWNSMAIFLPAQTCSINGNPHSRHFRSVSNRRTAPFYVYELNRSHIDHLEEDEDFNKISQNRKLPHLQCHKHAGLSTPDLEPFHKTHISGFPSVEIGYSNQIRRLDGTLPPYNYSNVQPPFSTCRRRTSIN